MPICEIKISLCLPAFGGYGSLDLGEIWQLRPWKGCSSEFWQCTFAFSHRNDSWEKHPLAHRQPEAASLLLFTAKAHTWLWGGRSLDLGEIYEFGPWKGCSFEFWPYALLQFRIEMIPWKTSPLRIGNLAHLACTFTAIYYKGPHLVG